jgi:hypothetical protein
LTDTHALFAPAFFALREFDKATPTLTKVSMTRCTTDDLPQVYETCLELQQHYANCKLPHAPLCAEQWAADWKYLHVTLHSAAHVLNPRYQGDPHHTDVSIWKDFLDVTERLLGAEASPKAMQQYHLYRKQQGFFGMPIALNQREATDPCDWWASYGAGTPELQELAMKVCSQPSSASSSEQNWSQYDYVHNKRRNRLKSDRANMLVFIYSSLRIARSHTAYRRHMAVSGSNVSAKPVIPEIDRIDGNASDTDHCECEPSDSDE